MSWRARLRRLTERINALSLRERSLTLLAVCAVIWLVWDMLAMQPIRERQQSVQASLEQVRGRVSALTTSIQELAQARGRNPNQALQARLARLEAETKQLEQRLTERHGGIATPRQSIAVLSELLAERAGVSLLAVESLPPERLIGPGGAEVPGVFMHRVRVHFESDFEAIRNYLAMLETLPPGVFWEALALTVAEWPRSAVELVLYSLTLDERWIGV